LVDSNSYWFRSVHADHELEFSMLHKNCVLNKKLCYALLFILFTVKTVMCRFIF
jgi:hypothetical protein